MSDPQYEYLAASLAGTIQCIKDGIATDNLSMAAEAWFELEDWQQLGLWKAPSKGGVLSTHERKVIKSSEFREAYYGSGSE